MYDTFCVCCLKKMFKGKKTTFAELAKSVAKDKEKEESHRHRQRIRSMRSVSVACVVWFLRLLSLFPILTPSSLPYYPYNNKGKEYVLRKGTVRGDTHRHSLL